MIEIKGADMPRDIKVLDELDQKCFPDLGGNIYKEEWERYRNFILYFKGRPVGYTSVQPNTGLYSYKTGKHERKPGSLHITVTGVLPRYRRKGLGDLLKTFIIAYARLGKFKSINATARKSNIPIIKLNKRFGFRIIREIKNFYPNGETAVVEELILKNHV